MSDSGGYGEALESMSTKTNQGQSNNPLKAIGGTIADFGKSAAKQVGGTGGVAGAAGSQQQNPMSGSFDLKGGPPPGIDLFSPDVKKPAPSQNQNPLGFKPLTQAGQKALSGERVYTPEEMQQIRKIEQELRSMHAENYYRPWLEQAEGRHTEKKQAEEQKKDAEEQKKQMEDLQKKEDQKKPLSVQMSQQSTEKFRGTTG